MSPGHKTHLMSPVTGTSGSSAAAGCPGPWRVCQGVPATPRSEGAAGPLAQSAVLVSQNSPVFTVSLPSSVSSLDAAFFPMLLHHPPQCSDSSSSSSSRPLGSPKVRILPSFSPQGSFSSVTSVCLQLFVLQLQSSAQEHKSLFSKGRFFHGLWCLFGVRTSPASPWGSDHRQRLTESKSSGGLSREIQVNLGYCKLCDHRSPYHFFP